MGISTIEYCRSKQRQLFQLIALVLIKSSLGAPYLAYCKWRFTCKVLVQSVNIVLLQNIAIKMKPRVQPYLH